LRGFRNTAQASEMVTPFEEDKKSALLRASVLDVS